MAINTNSKNTLSDTSSGSLSASVEELQLAALDRGNDGAETGRYLITYKAGTHEEARSLLKAQGMRVADARDFANQAVTMESAGDADSLFLPEIGVALISGDAAQERGLGAMFEAAADSPVESIDPEYFVFTENGSTSFVPESNFAGSTDNTAFELLNHSSPASHNTLNEYLRGFLRATEMITKDLRPGNGIAPQQIEEEAQVLGATWGLIACKVLPSLRSGFGIKVAVLSSGMDLGHPDFAGRSFTTATFVGQPVHDIYGHGTHMIGTACGPRTPAGTTPRYGIGYRSLIFVGKVLTNSGMGTTTSILNGMNWAIANRCPVIFTPIGVAGGPFPYYTAAGQAALNNGCLIIAGSSSSGLSVGAPANSPTIMSVAAVDQQLRPTIFSPTGKIDLVSPGANIFSSYPRPRLYNTWSGLASAGAHVAGCAALWAETSPTLRGLSLWTRLEATAKRYPPYFPPFPPKHPRLGAGLVQAP